MSQKVYCVEFGLYPEATTLGVYSTPENAQVVVDKVKADYLAEYEYEMMESEQPRIVETQLDKGVIEIKNGMELFEFYYSADGSYFKCYHVSFEEPYVVKYISRKIETDEEAEFLHGFVFAKDKDSVLQVVKEKVEEVNALQRGESILKDAYQPWHIKQRVDGLFNG